MNTSKWQMGFNSAFKGLIASKDGTMPGLWKDKAKCLGSTSGKDKRFFTFYNHSKELWIPPTSYSLGAGSFPWRGIN
jgi:hypothetical protein